MRFRFKFKNYLRLTSLNGLLRFVMIFLIIIPSLIMGLFLFNEYQTAKVRSVLDLNEMSNLQKNILENWLNDRLGDVNNFAESLRSLDREEVIQRLKLSLMTHRDFDSIEYINKEGVLVPLRPEDKPVYVGDQDYFRKTSAGERVVSDFPSGRFSGKRVIIFSAPVYNSVGEFDGVIIGSVSLTLIMDLLKGFSYGETGSAFILRTNGEAITQPQKRHSSEESDTIDTEAYQKYLQFLFVRYQSPEGNNIFKSYTDYRGVEVFGIYKDLTILPWVLIAEVDKNEIIGPIYRRMIFLGILYLLLLAVSVPVLMVMLGRIRIPVHHLLHAARKIQQGQYEVNINIEDAPRELELLAQSFNLMSSRLKDDFQVLSRMNHHLQEAELKYRTLVNSMNDIVFTVNENGKVTGIYGKGLMQFNKLRRGALSLIGKGLEEIFPQEGVEVHEKAWEKALKGEQALYEWQARISGTYFQTALSPIYSDAGKVTGFVGVARDITERRKIEEELRFVSLHDPLTGLYNRAYFEEELKRLKSGRFNPIGVIICDINGLKVVNDTLGHPIGDELIKKAGFVLKEAVRESDVVARIGGDEFVILLPHGSEEVVQEVCQRISRALDEANLETPHLPLYLALGQKVADTLSEGFLEEAFQIADNEMYMDKIEKNKTVREKIISRLLVVLESEDYEGLSEYYLPRIEQAAKNLGISKSKVV